MRPLAMYLDSMPGRDGNAAQQATQAHSNSRHRHQRTHRAKKGYSATCFHGKECSHEEGFVPEFTVTEL